MKIKSKGHQLFNIPNDAEGCYFLSLLRKYRQPGNQFRIKGRGSRKLHGNRSDISQEYSEWMAVYITNPRMEDARDINRTRREAYIRQSVKDKIIRFIESDCL